MRLFVSRLISLSLIFLPAAAFGQSVFSQLDGLYKDGTMPSLASIMTDGAFAGKCANLGNPNVTYGSMLDVFVQDDPLGKHVYMTMQTNQDANYFLNLTAAQAQTFHDGQERAIGSYTEPRESSDPLDAAVIFSGNQGRLVANYALRESVANDESLYVMQARCPYTGGCRLSNGQIIRYGEVGTYCYFWEQKL
jgi:hypothetical protein